MSCADKIPSDPRQDARRGRTADSIAPIYLVTEILVILPKTSGGISRKLRSARKEVTGLTGTI